jgi:hypothetical protein
MAFLVLENLRFPGQLMASATLPAQQILKKIGPDEALLLFHYQAQEHTRSYLSLWELGQIAIGLAVIVALLVADTKRKALPLGLGLAMFAIVLFQHFAIGPELAFRGRDADFPPGNRTFGVQARLWAMQEAYIGTEAVKLLMGGVLASFLFAYRVESRRRRKLDVIDNAHHSHVNG